jgi:hypothetical protein
LRDAASDATEGEGQTMTWSKAYDAMQKGRFIRRVSWEQHAVIRLFYKDEDSTSYFHCTPKTYQYLDEKNDGGYTFKDISPGDDWEIYPYKYNFDNHSWYYVGDL